MTDLISIIVPVYNTEKYLERCVNSLIHQTYQNIEIILVNDGSTDNSQSICEKFAGKNRRIHLINQKNGGSSIARNTGLINAKGNIISFVDSDDHLDLDMYRKMLTKLNEHKLDVVEIERNSESDKKKFDDSFTIEDRITAFARIIQTTSFQVWKRIYRRSLIDQMMFIPNIIHQDVFFTIDVINKVEKVGFLNTPLYNYNRESIGIIRSNYSAMKRDIAVKATEYIQSNLPTDEKLKKVMDNYIVHYYTDHYFLISRNTIFDKDKTHRAKLKRDIIKAAKISNLSLRPILVILLPIKIIEMISSLKHT